MKSPRVTGKSPSVALNGSTPSASSRRATMMARHSESRPESTSTRSSDSGARLLRCSLATCSKCERTVALTDMTSTFIETLDRNEITQGHRKVAVGSVERVDAERILETRDDDGEAQRVETRIHEHEIVGQRRQALALFLGDLLEMRENRSPDGHDIDLHRDPPTPSGMTPRGGCAMLWISACMRS